MYLAKPKKGTTMETIGRSWELYTSGYKLGLQHVRNSLPPRSIAGFGGFKIWLSVVGLDDLEPAALRLDQCPAPHNRFNTAYYARKLTYIR